MRHPVFALLAVASLVFPGCAQTQPALAEEDPALFFIRLEQRLIGADDFGFDVSLNEPTAEEDFTTALDGRLSFGAGNRVRVESDGEVNGLGARPAMVADGQHMTGGRNGIDSAFPDFAREPVPDDLRTDVIRSFLRWGASRTLLRLVAGLLPGFHETEEEVAIGDPVAHAPLENASWGLPETFDGTPVRPLSFELSPAFGASVLVTLWLDIETGLPRRRTTRIEFDSSERVTEEVYSGWTFDSATSPSLFTVPR